MATSTLSKQSYQSVSVFMIGNNPIDISNVYDKLKKSKKIRFVTETAFDITDMLKRILRFNPSCILLDDNLGKPELKRIVHKLVRDKRTQDIPLTIVKNSNYSDVITEGVHDYILKDSLNSESIYRSLANSRKLRKTQLYLYKSYKNNKNKLLSMLQPRNIH